MVYFELCLNYATGRWFWRLRGDNHKTLAHSEIYNSKQKAMQTITLLRNQLRPTTRIRMPTEKV